MLSRLSPRAAPRAWVAGLAACCALLLVAGCGPDYKARGLVKGKVTKGGKPLTTGTVMFTNKEGMSGQATIDPDGNYEMADAPVGECKVTVSVPNMPNDPAVWGRLKGKGPAMPGGPQDPSKEGPPPPPAARVPKEIVPIDAKYSNPDTSGLSFTVKKGEQTHNIEL